MRIMGFSKKWPKLFREEFTTFRLPRKDRDWEVGEQVEVVIKPRSKTREPMMIAEINEMEPVSIAVSDFRYRMPTLAEIQADGFENLAEMRQWVSQAHNIPQYCIPSMNKITLRRVNWLTYKKLPVYKGRG